MPAVAETRWRPRAALSVLEIEKGVCVAWAGGTCLLIFFLYKGQGFINCVQGQLQVFFSVPKADIGMMVG